MLLLLALLGALHLLPLSLGLLDSLLLRLLLLHPLGALRLLRPLLLSLLDALLRLLSALFLLLWLPGLLGTLRLFLLSLLVPPLLLRLLPFSLLLWLLSALCVLLLLRLLCTCLRSLLLCGWPRALLLFFRFALFFVLLLVLRVRRNDCREEQKQGSGAGNSDDLHCSRSSGRYWVCTTRAKWWEPPQWGNAGRGETGECRSCS